MTRRDWKRLSRKLARYRACDTAVSRRFFRRHPEFAPVVIVIGKI